MCQQVPASILVIYVNSQNTKMPFEHIICTLESLIDIGQGISVGPGRFSKKNKHRALNKRRAWKIWKKE